MKFALLFSFAFLSCHWIYVAATKTTTTSSTSSTLSLEEDIALLEENAENLIQSIESRIVGGTEVSPGIAEEKYTFMTSWHKHLHEHPECGGSLVAANLVLTAAHCAGVSGAVRIGSMLYDKTNLEAKVPGVEATVIGKYKNPNYTGGRGLFYDYMILELDRVVDTNLYKPIDLNFDASLTIDTVTAIGFGKEQQGGDQPKHLKHLTNIPVVSSEECIRSYPKKIDDDIQICAGFNEEGGQDSCVKDSGGPLVTTKEDGTLIQVGDVSWGKGCAQPHNPGVYARLSGANDWLTKTICEKKKGAYTPSYCKQAADEGVEVEPVSKKILLASTSFELRDRKTGKNRDEDDVMDIKDIEVKYGYKISHYGKQYVVLKDTFTSKEFTRDYAYKGYEISFYCKGSSSSLSIEMFYDGKESETIKNPKPNYRTSGNYNYYTVKTTKDIKDSMTNFKFVFHNTGEGKDDASSLLIDDVTVNGILPDDCNKICTSKATVTMVKSNTKCSGVKKKKFKKRCKYDNWIKNNICQYECYRNGDPNNDDQPDKCCTRLF